MLQFTSFVDNELKKYRDKVEEFNKNQDRQDDFCYNQVFANNCSDLSFAIKVVLNNLATVKHPQSNNIASTTQY